MRTVLTAVAITAVLACGSSAAQAATIGANPVGDIGCGIRTVGADPGYVAPSAGTVTSFSFQSTDFSTGNQLAFKVFRPVGGGDYTVVGETDVVTLTDTDLETFTPAAPILVQAGDILGWWTKTFVSGCAQQGTGGALARLQVDEPGVGDTLAITLPTGASLNVSAQFEPAPAPTCSNTPATVPGTTGTPGDDVIVGTPGNDVIVGGGGNDLICAGEGNDRVLGGEGDDRIFGGAGRDNLNGEAGNDKLFGEAGDDQVYGASGDDNVHGNAGDDRLNGGAGDDYVSGAAGDDALDGSSGGADAAEGGAGADSFAGFEAFIGAGGNGIIA